MVVATPAIKIDISTQSFGHRTCKYILRRSWDYLVRHPQGEEPPKEFDLRASDHSEWEP